MARLGRIWVTPLHWLFRAETALIASLALLVIAIVALARSDRPA